MAYVGIFLKESTLDGSGVGERLGLAIPLVKPEHEVDPGRWGRFVDLI